MTPGVSSKRVLITGGRSPAALELARQARGVGAVVFMAESLSHHLSRYSSSVERSYSLRSPNEDTEGFAKDLAEIAHRERIDVIIPTCEEAFFVARAFEQRRDFFPKSCQTWIDETTKLRMLHSKWEFQERARKIGDAPKTWLVQSEAELGAAIREASVTSRSLVLKPVFSRFASKTRVYHSPPHVQETGVRPSGEDPWVVQEFVAGQEFCAYAVAAKGRVFALVTYQNHFRAGLGAGIGFEAIDHQAIEAWIGRFVESEAFTGQIAFDFIESIDGRIFPLECNPRATSGVHFFNEDSRFVSILLEGPEGPRMNERIRPVIGSQRMVSLAMMTFGLVSIRSVSCLLKWIRTFRGSKETVFKWSDPLPFFTQFASLFHFWKVSRASGRSLLEASTADIEWDGK